MAHRATTLSSDDLRGLSPLIYTHINPMAASRSISTGALTWKERTRERHDGYTHKDATSEHPGPAFWCSFRVVSGLMDSPGQGHTQNEQLIGPHWLCQGLDRAPDPTPGLRGVGDGYAVRCVGREFEPEPRHRYGCDSGSIGPFSQPCARALCISWNAYSASHDESRMAPPDRAVDGGDVLLRGLRDAVTNESDTTNNCSGALSITVAGS